MSVPDNYTKKEKKSGVRKPGCILAFIVIALVIASPFILRKILLTPEVAEKAMEVICEQVGAALSMPLEMGELSVDIFGRVVISGVKLGDGDTAILEAGRLVAGISLLELLRRNSNPGNLVKYVRVEKPFVRVIRLETGDWNYTPLFKSTEGAADAGLPEFPVFITGGAALFEDRFAENPLPITKYEVTGISGKFSMLEELVLLLEVKADKGTEGEKIEAALRFDLRAGWRVEGSAARLPMEFITGLAGAQQFKVSGTLDRVDFFVESAYTSIGNPPNFTWGGNTKAAGAMLVLENYGLTLTDVSADIELVNGAISFENGSGLLGTGDVWFSGSIHSSGMRAMVIESRFENVPAKDAAPIIGLSPKDFSQGNISGAALLTGPSADLNALVTVEASALRYGKLRADTLSARAVYSGRRLSLDRVEMRKGKGLAVFSGIVDFAEDNTLEEYRMTVDLERMDIPELIRAGGSEVNDVGGALSGKLFVRGGPEGTPTVVGTVESPALAVTGLTPGEALCSFLYENELLSIENLVVENGEETVVARGTVDSDGNMDIEVAGARGGISALLAVFGRDDLESAGSMTFRGHLGGTLEKPALDGKFEGREIAVSTFHADRITGGLAYDGSVLEMKDISIYSGLDRHEMAGKINFSERTLIVYLIMQDTALSDLAGLARDMFRIDLELPEDFNGTINAKGLVMGSFDKPVISLKLAASNITLYGENIDSMEALVDYIDYPIINKGLVRFAGAAINVSGALDPENMNLAFAGSGLMIERINHVADLRASGTLSISGVATGSFESPSIMGEITPGKMFYRNVDFTASPASASYNSGEFRLEDVKISRGDENYQASVKYDFAAQSYDVQLALQNAALKTLTQFLPFSIPDGTSGTLDGGCRVFVSFGDYSGILNLSGSNLTIGTYPISEMVMEGNFEENKLNITKFESRNDVSEVELSGMLDLDQKIASEMNIRAYGIELARFSEMGLLPESVGGLADIDIEMIGENGTQKMIGSITAHNPEMYGLEFDRARGSFEFDGNVLSISDLQFLTDAKRISLAMDIPLQKGFEDRFSIRPSTKDLDLSVINSLLAHYGIQLDGMVALDDVRIAGSMKNPEFTGAFTLSDVVFKHSDLGVPVTGINGKMHFTKNTLVVESVQGTIQDQKVSIHGSMDFKGLVPDTFDFQMADADNVYVEYKEIYKGRANLRNFAFRKTAAGMETYSPTDQPPAVTLHHASIYPPQADPEAAGKPGASIGFGPRPVSVTVADNVVIKSGRNTLRLETRGKLLVSGSTAKPSIDGWLTSERGHIRYLGNTFKMVENAIIGFYSIEGVGVVPIFYMMAETRVSGTDVTMRMSGPMVDVNLYPAFRELCSGSDSIGTSAGLNVPRIPMGETGDISVPVCPEADFIAYDDNNAGGQLMSTQQIMHKLTHTERLMDSAETEKADILRTEAISMFTPFVGSVVEKGVNLENFSINLDPNKDVLVQLEKRVAEKLYIKYERLFSRKIEETVEARYKFRNRSFLKWGIDQDNIVDLQVEYQLRF